MVHPGDREEMEGEEGEKQREEDGTVNEMKVHEEGVEQMEEKEQDNTHLPSFPQGKLPAVAIHSCCTDRSKGSGWEGGCYIMSRDIT